MIGMTLICSLISCATANSARFTTGTAMAHG